MRGLMVLCLVALVAGSRALDSTAPKANETEFEALGCSKSEKQCTCKLAGMSEAAQYQELVVMKKQMKSVMSELDKMESYKLLKDMRALADNIQAMKKDLESQEIAVSVARITEMHADLNVLTGLVSSLEGNVTAERIRTVKKKCEILQGRVKMMLEKNAHGSVASLMNDMTVLRDQLATCKDSFRDANASFFRGDTLSLGDQPNICDTHVFDGFGDPVSHAWYGHQGSWFKDPYPPTKANKSEIYKLKYSITRGVDVQKMSNYKVFIGKKPQDNMFSDTYDRGYGMLMYKNILFFSHNTEPYVWVRYPSNTVGKPVRLSMSYTRYQGDPSDTYITYAADHTGLYAITSDPNRRIAVHKLAINMTTMPYPDISVEEVWVIEKPKASVCATVIVCGTLYALDDCALLGDRLGYKSTFMYNMAAGGSEGEYKKLRTLVSPFSRIYQLSYNPREMLFFGWDSGHAITIPVKWKLKQEL